MMKKTHKVLNSIKRFVFFGSLRKLSPMSRIYGFDRGLPIDRYYIEKFLKANAGLIKGRVLEIRDNQYTLRFGKKKVLKSDILDIDCHNKRATIYADLRKTKGLPKDQYDCIVLTQVLQLIDNLDAVIKNLHQMLKKGGVLLATMPSVSRIDCVAKEKGDYWRFTKASAEYIFGKYFEKRKLKIKSFGNVFVDICFLEGIAVEEISTSELEYYDKNFPLIICVKAVK